MRGDSEHHQHQRRDDVQANGKPALNSKTATYEYKDSEGRSASIKRTDVKQWCHPSEAGFRISPFMLIASLLSAARSARTARRRPNGL
jgi:hypothetical protein